MILQGKSAIMLDVKGGRACCPKCGRPTSVRILPTTVLFDYPLFCKHCKDAVVVKYRVPVPESQSLTMTPP